MAHPLLSLLTRASDSDGAGALRYVHHLPPRRATTEPWPEWIDPRVARAFSEVQGVAAPWAHQVAAWRVLAQGRHLALATETGSGKSLIAWAPALSAALAPPSGRISELSRPATTLYLSPTKALAHDQVTKLEAILQTGHLPEVQVAAADGDATAPERSFAQERANVVFSNPDFLHHSLLPRSQYWGRLLRGLTYVFVDELHTYRGMTGAHVSLVVRRLLRLARRAGARPQVIVASATALTPGSTVATFLGVDPDAVGVVDQSTAPQGRRTIALWDPSGGRAPAEREAGGHSDPDRAEQAAAASANTAAAGMLGDFARAGAATLVFTRARATAEAIAEMARTAVGAAGQEKIAAYRGGYLPEERRRIEADLHARRLLGVATTSALEMGIDISGLDAVIIAGWPGTRASFWQQAGRTGRAGTDGLAVFIASENLLDHYLLAHPEHLFDTPVESAVFDPANPHVLAPHLCAAAAEAPLSAADLADFPPQAPALLEELRSRGLLRERGGRWFWNYDRPETPSSLANLRGSGGQVVSVVEHGTGRVVGTVAADRADATVHVEAVYIHQGQAFSIVDRDGEIAVATPTDAALRTRAISSTRVEVIEVAETFQAGAAQWNFGTVNVHSQVVAYQQLRLPGLVVLGTYPLEMPERTLRTSSVWWHIEADTLTASGIAPADIPGALHAAEHALIALLGLVATCDRWDLGGLSTAVHDSTLGPTVFVHDAFPGGSGFARRGFHAARTWVAATEAAVRECPCTQGCPRCIQSPKCGNANKVLDKAGAITVLHLLLRGLSGPDGGEGPLP